MKNYIVTIKHVTGDYDLRVSESKKDELQEHIMLCVNDKQKAFSNTDLNGNVSIYPSEFLKQSFISINEDHGVRSSSSIETEWN